MTLIERIFTVKSNFQECMQGINQFYWTESMQLSKNSFNILRVLVLIAIDARGCSLTVT